MRHFTFTFMRHNIPFVVSIFYVVLLWICILAHERDEDWAIKSMSYDSGTQYFIHGYIVNKPMLRIPRVPERNCNQSLQSRTGVSVSPKLYQNPQSFASSSIPTAHLMCICINCARVINCSAYHFVETKHEQPHIVAEPTFTPRDGSPTIHVNIRTSDRTSLIGTTTDGRSNMHDVSNRIRNESTKLVRSEKISKPEFENRVGETSETAIPISTTYTEYDVVACTDYVEEMNCWIRNMPDEIKRANPNFVPT